MEQRKYFVDNNCNYYYTHTVNGCRNQMEHIPVEDVCLSIEIGMVRYIWSNKYKIEFGKKSKYNKQCQLWNQCIFVRGDDHNVFFNIDFVFLVFFAHLESYFFFIYFLCLSTVLRLLCIVNCCFIKSNM